MDLKPHLQIYFGGPTLGSAVKDYQWFYLTHGIHMQIYCLKLFVADWEDPDFVSAVGLPIALSEASRDPRDYETDGEKSAAVNLWHLEW